MGALLPREFYARDALAVARDLLGCVLVRGGVALRITETEAYRHPDDSASHCRAGRTPRNEPMWGPPGHAYVYLCYGMHSMLNLVTDEDGEGAAVLVRAAEVLEGAELVAARRGLAPEDARALRGTLVAGPGKVGQALALAPSLSGQPLFREGGLEVRGGEPPAEVLVGPRVGIEYALPADRAAPYRFADARSPAVTRPRTLRPLIRHPRTR